MAKGGLSEQPREGDGSPDNRQNYTKRPLSAGPGDFAKGGAVIQEKRSRFAKFGGAEIESKPAMFESQKDPFRTDSGRQDYEKTSPGGELSRETGDKSETPVKPRK